jgi:hypothetical protein
MPAARLPLLCTSTRGPIHWPGSAAVELLRSAIRIRICCAQPRLPATYDAGLAALRPGRAFGSVVDAMREVLDRADGWEFGPSLHALNHIIALSEFPADATKHIPGVDVYPPEPDHPTIGADMMLKPGMTFAMEPNYVFGRHLAYVGGTVIVGDPAPWNSTPTRPKFCAPKAKAGSDDRVHRKETV